MINSCACLQSENNVLLIQSETIPLQSCCTMLDMTVNLSELSMAAVKSPDTLLSSQKPLDGIRNLQRYLQSYPATALSL